MSASSSDAEGAAANLHVLTRRPYQARISRRNRPHVKSKKGPLHTEAGMAQGLALHERAILAARRTTASVVASAVGAEAEARGRVKIGGGHV